MDTLNSKDALFMLDTDIEQDMASYADEATGLVIKYINSNAQLYRKVKTMQIARTSIAETCTKWAKEHGDEFGPLFITELDVVKWDEVARRV